MNYDAVGIRRNCFKFKLKNASIYSGAWRTMVSLQRSRSSISRSREKFNVHLPELFDDL